MAYVDINYNMDHLQSLITYDLIYIKFIINNKKL